MTETTEMQSTELVTLDPVQYVNETFAPFRAQLQDAKVTHARVTYDVTNKQGYETAKEIWRKYKDMRINSEKNRKTRKDPIIKIGKLIDEVHGSLEAEIKSEEEFYEQQWRAEDERQEAIKAEQIRIEQERKAAIDSALARLVDAPANGIGMSASQVAELLNEIRATEITPEVFGDRDVEAENAKYKAIDALQQLHSAKVAQESQAEAEAQRAQEMAHAQAEESRISNIKTKILLIENAIAQAALLDTSAEVQLVIDKVTGTVIDESFAEFKDEAEGVKSRVLKALERTMKMVKAEEAAQQINEAKPQVSESEAVTLSSQDQLTEPASSLTQQTEQAFTQQFEGTKTAPSRSEIVEMVMDKYGVTYRQAETWLVDMFYALAA